MLADAQICRDIARRHARTFWLASLLLPARRRRGAHALYAFCRLADDIVDENASATTDTVARALASHRQRLIASLDGHPDGPVFRELAWAVQEFGIPAAPLLELVDGVGADLSTLEFNAWSDLERYCQGVASSVGEMSAYVFGVPSGVEHAVGFARTLGTAMQLTNILRDVGDDARRGRCYLPLDALREVGLTHGDVLRFGIARQLPTDERQDAWNALMRREVRRARSLYAASRPGIALLAQESRPCARACATGYERILSQIELNNYDTVSRRASLSWPARVGVLASAWFSRDSSTTLSAAPPAVSARD